MISKENLLLMADKLHQWPENYYAPAVKMLCEAADELERLRAQVASGDDLTVAYMAGAHDARRAAPATDKKSHTWN